MARYTERLTIKMTPEDMQLLAVESLKAKLPMTTYAREVILSRINPMFTENGNEVDAVAKTTLRAVED